MGCIPVYVHQTKAQLLGGQHQHGMVCIVVYTKTIPLQSACIVGCPLHVHAITLVAT